MSYSEIIKVNLHHGGLVVYKDEKFRYVGGSLRSDIVIDPDYMTWSMFDDFCEDNRLGTGLVEQAWFKLPQEDMGSLKRICKLTSDSEITEMCKRAMEVGEVDIFIEQSMNAQGRENETVEDEEEECDDGDDKAPENADGDNAEGEEVIEDGGDDTRFQEFRDEVSNEEAPGLGLWNDNAPHVVAEDAARNDEDDEAEFERQCRDDELLLM